jgi:ubiquinone/menaquinone biosynthesis C-methylase UbiE
MSPQSMLDIGCGDGSISVPVLTPRNRLTLVDMSATMLGIARSRVSADLSTRVTTINDQFMNARLAPASFDLILCLGVLAYVSDSRAFAERIASLLGPRGDVIVECSDSSNAVSKLRRALGTVTGVLAPGKVPLILHSSAEVTGIFGQLGFALKGSFRYSLPLPGIRKFMSQGVQYKTTRALYGSAAKNRLPWLGSECIYHFRRES